MIPRLHVVTDDALLADPVFVRRAQGILEVGGPGLALHVRGPHTSGARVFEIARGLQPTAAASGALLLVNDRSDVALALELGAHLGCRSLPIGRVRALLGASAAIGVSVRGVETARQVAPGRPDYLIVGTVFTSPSHPGQPVGGPALISDLSEFAGAPLLGIGGVLPETVAPVLEAGGHGVAVLSGIWHARRPESAVEEYLQALTDLGG